MKIIYKTTLSDKSHDDIWKMALEQKNEEAIRECLIRSTKAWFFQDTTPAIALCDEKLQQCPQDNLYNLIRGHHERDLVKKKKYYDTAARTNSPCGDVVSAQASLELAKLYHDEKKYIEAQAWLVRAILLGSEEAQTCFLGYRDNNGIYNGKLSALNLSLTKDMCNTALSDKELLDKKFDKNGASWRALSFATFIAVVLAKKNFNAFSSSVWAHYWKPEYKEEYVAIHYNPDALTAMTVKNSIIHNTIASIINCDPYIILNFFNYCFYNHIIADEVYIRVIELFLNNVPNPDHLPGMKDVLTDKLLYAVFRYQLIHKEWAAAFGTLDRISTKFSEFKVSDLPSLSADEQDNISYEVFKKLVARKQFKEALPFLNNVKSLRIMDATLFDYFDGADPEKKHSHIQQFKLELFEKIIKADNIQRPIYERVFNELQYMRKKPYQLRLLFHSIIEMFEEYIEIREQRKKENPSFFWTSDAIRQQFISAARLLGNQTLHLARPLTKLEYEALLQEFTGFINQWNTPKMDGKQTKLMFASALERVEDIRKMMTAMNDNDYIITLSAAKPQDLSLHYLVPVEPTPAPVQYFVPTQPDYNPHAVVYAVPSAPSENVAPPPYIAPPMISAPPPPPYIAPPATSALPAPCTEQLVQGLIQLPLGEKSFIPRLTPMSMPAMPLAPPATLSPPVPVEEKKPVDPLDMFDSVFHSHAAPAVKKPVETGKQYLSFIADAGLLAYAAPPTQPVTAPIQQAPRIPPTISAPPMQRPTATAPAATLFTRPVNVQQQLANLPSVPRDPFLPDVNQQLASLQIPTHEPNAEMRVAMPGK